jgi:uncharacterized protein (DUF2252 family)
MGSAAARAEAGKELRKAIPRRRHGEWFPAPDRADPLELLSDVAQGRLPFLMPLRNTRMQDTPFTFYRGSAAIMAADLAGSPHIGLPVQACGDAHCLNFGGFATPERNVIFDLNDFDETLPGPWEWDLKRLVTSFVLAARAIGLRRRDAEKTALVAAYEYRMKMRELAAMPALDVWYSRLHARKILDEAKGTAARNERSRIVSDASTSSIHAALEKFTEVSGGSRRLIEREPDLFHSPETETTGFDVPQILQAYAATLSPDVRVLFERYRLVDHAIKVVGVGSVGTRCALALYMADDHDPLLLQIKEARPSVLERYLEPSVFANAGERVVRGQRLMQAASDIFLGWAASGPYHFYVRQFRDMKASANIEGAKGSELADYARYCAWALAAAHARSGDAATIAGYLGSKPAMDRALLAFALCYVDVVESDYARFTDATGQGVLETAEAA